MFFLVVHFRKKEAQNFPEAPLAVLVAFAGLKAGAVEQKKKTVGGSSSGRG